MRMVSRIPPAAVITGIAHHLPAQIVSSDETTRRVQHTGSGVRLPLGLIERLSGVRERRHAAADETSSDLAVAAALQALARANLAPTAIDVLIFAAASHDVAEPATANIVQHRLGCTQAHVFDVKNACNSFLNALDLAHALIQTRRAHRILLTTGEVLSPTINYHITSHEHLHRQFAGLTLGDGGAACVVEAVHGEDAPRGLLRGRFFSDGSQWQLSTVLSGGTLMRHDNSRYFFECDSAHLQTLALEHLPRLIAHTMQELEWDFARDVQLVVAHQVSLRVIRKIATATGYPLERCMLTLNKLGNTAAASIPIALSIAVEQGRVQCGDKVLLVGGAAGFSAAVVPLVW